MKTSSVIFVEQRIPPDLLREATARVMIKVAVAYLYIVCLSLSLFCHMPILVWKCHQASSRTFFLCKFNFQITIYVGEWWEQ